MVAARKVGDDAELRRDEWPLVDVIPFDSQRQYMATLHATADGRRLMCLKGAPEVVVRWCSRFGDGSALHPERIDEEVHALASRGLRVLAVASAEPPASLVEFSDHEPPTGLRFLGLMGMIDPPRPEALAAIVACRAAGIRVTMVTGDHPSTARAVAAELGLLDTDASGDAVVTGRRMSQASDVELQDLAQTHRVFNVLFHTHPLSAADWIAPSVVALLGLPIVAIEKRFWRRRGRRTLHEAQGR